MWRLTTAERKRILIDNIFGVDIDPQAVEVAQLSLLLKVIAVLALVVVAVLALARLTPALEADDWADRQAPPHPPGCRREPARGMIETLTVLRTPCARSATDPITWRSATGTAAAGRTRREARRRPVGPRAASAGSGRRRSSRHRCR